MYAMIMEAKPTQYAVIMEAKPTQYAMIMEAKPTQYAASPSRRSRASESFEAEQSIRVLTLAWGGPAADAGWTPCSLRSHGADRLLRTLAWGGPAADAGWTPCSLNIARS